MRSFARKFYKSRAWQKCREAYIASVFGLCEKCLKKDVIKPGKIVHHKIELTPENINDPNISLNWDYLEYQCQECHNEEHHKKEGTTREGLVFDANGDLIEE